jgi:CheY-like chemotaxis protein
MTERPLVAVVDDDISVRESLPELLQQVGFAVRAFASAEAFLTSDAADATSCLVLDVGLPGMTGPDLQRELGRRGERVPVVFITAKGDKSDPIFPIDKAAERVWAAAEAAKKLPFKFMLCARAENYLRGREDLADTIKRLQAYQEAGADVLFAPGLTTSEEIRAVCKAVDRPFNVMRGPRKEMLSVAQLAELGVKRVSLGGFLQAAAMASLIEAARELATTGTFEFTKRMSAAAEIDTLLTKGTPS